MANGQTTEFNGRLVVDNKRAKAQAEALANTSPIHRLTQERLAAKPKPEPVPAEPAGYFDGQTFVRLNDSIGVA